MYDWVRRGRDSGPEQQIKSGHQDGKPWALGGLGWILLLQLLLLWEGRHWVGSSSSSSSELAVDEGLEHALGLDVGVGELGSGDDDEGCAGEEEAGGGGALRAGGSVLQPNHEASTGGDGFRFRSGGNPHGPTREGFEIGLGRQNKRGPKPPKSPAHSSPPAPCLGWVHEYEYDGGGLVGMGRSRTRRSQRQPERFVRGSRPFAAASSGQLLACHFLFLFLFEQTRATVLST